MRILMMLVFLICLNGCVETTAYTRQNSSRTSANVQQYYDNGLIQKVGRNPNVFVDTDVWNQYNIDEKVSVTNSLRSIYFAITVKDYNSGKTLAAYTTDGKVALFDENGQIVHKQRIY